MGFQLQVSDLQVSKYNNELLLITIWFFFFPLLIGKESTTF